MKILQPIEWHDKDGNLHRGIVTEEMPFKQGVIARSTANPNEAVIVEKPHKIKDVETMAAVWKALGIAPKIAADAGFLTPSKPVVKKAPIVTEEQAKSAFDKAMAEIDDMFSPDINKGLKDKLFLNSVGFNFTEGALPNAKED